MTDKIAIEQSLGQSSHQIHNWVIKTIQELNLGGDILDFGAGKGDLTKRLKQCALTKNLCGADLYPRPQDIDKNIQWLQEDLNSIQLPKQQFDLILAIEVLEHLENPRNVFRKFHQALKEGGHVLITTPNVESARSLISLMARGYFVDFGPSSYPAHITPLQEVDLRRLSEESHFEILRLDFSDRGVLPKFTFLTWQAISFGLLKGKRFSDQIMLVLRKGNL